MNPNDIVNNIIGKKQQLSKCCGEPYIKIDGISYCSNCNMEK